MNEISVVVEQTPGVITTNFAELKLALKEQMQIYKELTVTEENKAERKKDISILKKIQKAINDERIKQERKYMETFENYKNESKEMIEIINEPILLIDMQVKEMEEKARLSKISEITEYFNSIIGEDLEEFIPLHKVYDNRWENISISLNNAKKELLEKVENIRTQATLIRAMKSEKEVQALDTLYETLDVTKAITLINNYEQQKKEIEERLKRDAELEEQRKLERERAEKERILEEERAKVRREEQARIEAENKMKEEERARVIAEQEEKERMAAAEKLEFMTIKEESGLTELNIYMITATVEECEMLEMYMDSVGISFQKGE
jgi:hypothetical protein